MREAYVMAERRPTRDEYFMLIARAVSARATCPRKHVGAVIVEPTTGIIISTGYNGAPRDQPHCEEVGCDLKDLGGRQSCIRVIHSETNAILNAARHGLRIDGATLYTTASPCADCGKFILNSGIKRVVFGEKFESRYGVSAEVPAMLEKAGVEVVHLA